MSNSEAMIKSFVQRFETLFTEAAGVQEAMADLSKEVKGTGLDAATIKKLAKIRVKNQLEKEREKQSTLQMYAAAVQMDLFQ